MIYTLKLNGEQLFNVRYAILERMNELKKQIKTLKKINYDTELQEKELKNLKKIYRKIKKL